jgi:hypothetical protein
MLMKMSLTKTNQFHVPSACCHFQMQTASAKPHEKKSTRMVVFYDHRIEGYKVRRK